MEADPLLARREHYGPQIPNQVLIVTAGIDVQANRLECTFLGHGTDKEKWLLDHIVLPGDPTMEPVWDDLEKQLLRHFEAEDGSKLRVVSAMIDSGFNTLDVYKFVGPREIRKVFASKGVATNSTPFLKPGTVRNKYGVTLQIIGTDQAKEELYSHLRLKNPGPGYCHFPFKGVFSEEPFNLEYFKGLTAEKKERKPDKRGNFKDIWIKEYRRNEPLDCYLLATAAFYILKVDMDSIASHRLAYVEKNPALAPKVKGRRTLSKEWNYKHGSNLRTSSSPFAIVLRR